MVISHLGPSTMQRKRKELRISPYELISEQHRLWKKHRIHVPPNEYTPVPPIAGHKNSLWTPCEKRAVRLFRQETNFLCDGLQQIIEEYWFAVIEAEFHAVMKVNVGFDVSCKHLWETFIASDVCKMLPAMTFVDQERVNPADQDESWMKGYPYIQRCVFTGRAMLKLEANHQANQATLDAITSTRKQAFFIKQDRLYMFTSNHSLYNTYDLKDEVSETVLLRSNHNSPHEIREHTSNSFIEYTDQDQVIVTEIQLKSDHVKFGDSVIHTLPHMGCSSEYVGSDIVGQKLYRWSVESSTKIDVVISCCSLEPNYVGYPLGVIRFQLPETQKDPPSRYAVQRIYPLPVLNAIWVFYEIIMNSGSTYYVCLVRGLSHLSLSLPKQILSPARTFSFSPDTLSWKI